MNRWRHRGILLMTALLLAACNLRADLTPTRTPTPLAPTLTLVPTVQPTRVSVIVPSATNTPPPSNTPPPTSTVTPIPTPTPSLQAQIPAERGGLRLRAAPGQSGAIITYLDALTALQLIGRTADNGWLQVITPDGRTGWVSALYVAIYIDLNSVPVTSEAVVDVPVAGPAANNPSAGSAPAAVSSFPNYVSGVTANARGIFLKGQTLGNRANVFSKVGDSLTVATYVLYPFGWGAYNLRDFAYLEPALLFFSGTPAREGNSFANISLSADNGWTTAYILSPDRANPSLCQPGETPLACEYRVVKPSTALILIGTNDVGLMSGGEFSANLSRIVQTSIDMGVIPVLTTIPNRIGYEGAVAGFNQIIISTARGYDVPLVDYWSAMQSLPNSGLSWDGIHPSWPPGDGTNFADAADFKADNLQYGYVIRNLTALQALDALMRQVLY